MSDIASAGRARRGGVEAGAEKVLPGGSAEPQLNFQRKNTGEIHRPGSFGGGPGRGFCLTPRPAGASEKCYDAPARFLARRTKKNLEKARQIRHPEPRRKIRDGAGIRSA